MTNIPGRDPTTAGHVGIGDRSVVDFDHNSADHAADTVASYRRVRDQGPVVWTEAHGGYWVLTTYGAVLEAARHNRIFSSRRYDEYGGPGLAVTIPKLPTPRHIPIELDLPEFRPYRKMMNDVCSQEAVEGARDLIRHYATTFIDDIIEQGEGDLATVIGVPAAVTIHWLGIPPREWRRYAGAYAAIVTGVRDSEAYIRAVEVDMPYMTAQILQTIRARRVEPQEDVISYFAHYQVDGAPVDDDTVYSMVEMLISGGTGTTASLLGQALIWLSGHPEVRQELIDDPSKLDLAIEEFLRIFTPNAAIARTLVQDYELSGCPMRKGDRVLLAWASANRDEAQFDQPDEVDITRWPNRHTAFGLGIHHCVGMHFARSMARETLAQVLERMPDFAIDTTRTVPLANQANTSGFARIPATFTPGPRRGHDVTTNPKKGGLPGCLGSK